MRSACLLFMLLAHSGVYRYVLHPYVSGGALAIGVERWSGHMWQEVQL